MTINLCSLPIGTRLRTRDGRSARLLATDLRDSGWLPIVVAVAEADYEYIEILHASGRRCECCEEHPDDIVSIEDAAMTRADAATQIRAVCEGEGQ